MSASIVRQIECLKKLLDILNGYTDNLRYHAITAPKEAIEEGLRWGLPEEIGMKYYYRYYIHNQIDADNIIRYINSICIPALEGKIKKLQEVLDLQ